MKSFQKIIKILFKFWKQKGCITLYSLDLEIGAATSHLYTFFKSINNKPWYSIYIQNCRRPDDINSFYNSIKLQKYYQLQVILKPTPKKVLNFYLESLKKIKINFKKNKIKFVENNWENPSLGAYGVGWEIFLNDLEISQLTFFKKMASINCNPVLVEITYGLERIIMNLQKINNIYNILWDLMFDRQKITYGDVHFFYELEYSIYNFNNYDLLFLFNLFNFFELQIKNSIKLNLVIISYEYLLKLCHLFNLIDSKSGIFIIEKINFIRKIRILSCIIAKLYIKKFNIYV